MKNYLFRMMLTWFLANWKTTLTGALGWVLSSYGAAFLAQHGVSQAELTAAIVALVALFAKDGDKSNAPVPTATASSSVSAPKVVQQDDTSHGG